MTFEFIAQELSFINLKAALIFPAILMLLDFATGFVNAWVKHEVSSSKMREGGGKKFGEAVCICVAMLFVAFMNLPQPAAYLVSLYVVVMETVSIVENIKLLGVQVPGKVDDKIDDLKEDLKPKKKDDKK